MYTSSFFLVFLIHGGKFNFRNKRLLYTVRNKVSVPRIFSIKYSNSGRCDPKTVTGQLVLDKGFHDIHALSSSNPDGIYC